MIFLPLALLLASPSDAAPSAQGAPDGLSAADPADEGPAPPALSPAHEEEEDDPEKGEESAERRIADPFRPGATVPREPEPEPRLGKEPSGREHPAAEQRPDPADYEKPSSPRASRRQALRAGPLDVERPRASRDDQLISLVSQIALAIAVPVGCVVGHYVLTALTFFAWPLVGYPAAIGYALTCAGNSFGKTNKQAFWPIMAALSSSCAGWAGVIAAAIGLTALSLTPLTNANSGIAGALYIPLLLVMFGPPLLAGVSATAVFALDDGALPSVNTCGRPRMGLGENVESLLEGTAPAREDDEDRFAPPRRSPRALAY